jgi:hypothetical protein
VGFTVFPASQLGASRRKWGSRFRLGDVEPNFKEFLASPSMMHLGLMPIKPEVGFTKSFPACNF